MILNLIVILMNLVIFYSTGKIAYMNLFVAGFVFGVFTINSLFSQKIIVRLYSVNVEMVICFAITALTFISFNNNNNNLISLFTCGVFSGFNIGMILHNHILKEIIKDIIKRRELFLQSLKNK